MDGITKLISEGMTKYNNEVHKREVFSLMSSVAISESGTYEDIIDPRDKYKNSIVGIFKTDINNVKTHNSLNIYETSKTNKKYYIVEQIGTNGCTAAASATLLLDKLSKIPEDLVQLCHRRDRSMMDIVERDLSLAKKNVTKYIKNFNIRTERQKIVDNMYNFVKKYGIAILSYDGHVVVIDDITSDKKFMTIRDPYVVQQLVLDIDKLFDEYSEVNYKLELYSIEI